MTHRRNFDMNKAELVAAVAEKAEISKKDAEPFKTDGRLIYKIGVSFSSETRGIEEWRIE